jgi:Helix-turn-helix domain/RodZ C-terminal domain
MAPQVGQVLQRARTERGFELDEVERVTKIREKFLRAMEEDRWDALPAPAYAEGFLDIYARFLGLDHKQLLDEYRLAAEETAAPEAVPPGAVQAGVRTRSRARRSGVFTRTRARRTPPVKPLVVFVAGVAAVAVLGAVIVDAIIGSGNGGGAATQHQRQAVAGVRTTTTADAVSLELRSTADVWVCAVDGRDRPVVDGETLTAGESRGPFTGQQFELTFGNGSIEMTVNGEAVRVPAVAEPIGYRVTPSGASRLDPASGPSCV